MTPQDRLDFIDVLNDAANDIENVLTPKYLNLRERVCNACACTVKSDRRDYKAKVELSAIVGKLRKWAEDYRNG